MMRKAWIFGGLFIILVAVSAGSIVVMQIPDVNHQLSPGAARIVVNLTTPLNDTTIPIAQATLIQADALDTQPITALELWVDGNLFSSQSTPQPDLTNWSAFWSWAPSGAGPHVLIVRALDVGKHAVYSDAVNVTASADASISVVADYKTKQGDTLASVARQVGRTSQQLANLNPQLDPNNPIPPGDVINVPMPTWPPNAGNSNPNPPTLPTRPQLPSAPTATFRPVPLILPTIQPPLPPAKPSIGNPNANPKRFFWGGTICGATQTAITVLATDPDGIRDVQLYYRVRNSSRTEDWASAAMSTVVINFVPFWRQTIAGSTIPGYYQSKQPWQVQYYFVATSSRGVQTSSPFYDNVTLLWCNLSH